MQQIKKLTGTACISDLNRVDDAHMEEEKQEEVAVVPAFPTLNVTPPCDVTIAPGHEPTEKTDGMDED